MIRRVLVQRCPAVPTAPMRPSFPPKTLLLCARKTERSKNNVIPAVVREVARTAALETRMIGSADSNKSMEPSARQTTPPRASNPNAGVNASVIRRTNPKMSRAKPA